MTKVVVDADFWSRLNNPQGPVELCDPSGRTLGYLYPAPACPDSGSRAVVRLKKSSGTSPSDEIHGGLEGQG
jgi:hypothetical protein